MEPIWIWIERWIGFTFLGKRIGWWRGHTFYRTAYGKDEVPQVEDELLSETQLTWEAIDDKNFRLIHCGPGWEEQAVEGLATA